MPFGDEPLSAGRLRRAVDAARECGFVAVSANDHLAFQTAWLDGVLAPILKRDPDELGGRLCVGPVDHCAELLSRYAQAGCQRVYLWPLGQEQRQLELVASEVVPLIARN
jgi:alkanesulfonate monooxygenase SsuD/methylene tetrahydromethanopterin reductase-like flavin-dependent oxidoreductase (luciferase family)